MISSYIYHWYVLQSPKSTLFIYWKIVNLYRPNYQKDVKGAHFHEKYILDALSQIEEYVRMRNSSKQDWYSMELQIILWLRRLRRCVAFGETTFSLLHQHIRRNIASGMNTTLSTSSSVSSVTTMSYGELGDKKPYHYSLTAKGYRHTKDPLVLKKEGGIRHKKHIAQILGSKKGFKQGVRMFIRQNPEQALQEICKSPYYLPLIRLSPHILKDDDDLRFKICTCTLKPR